MFEIPVEVSDVWFGGAREVVLGAIGTASVLAAYQAWNYWGKGRWEAKMQKRQGELRDIALVRTHMAGALEYLLKDDLITPQRLWAILPKLDGHFPHLRVEMRTICKKYLPHEDVPEEEPKAENVVHFVHKLRLFGK